MKRIATAIVLFLALGAQSADPGAAPTVRMRPPPPGQGRQQAPLETDMHYDARVASPAYVETHPVVLFDEAHHNFHTPGTRYKPFADLISNDGYRIVSNRQSFTAAALAGHDVLVIVNAMGPEGLEAYFSSAFTEAECGAVADWVRAGGALLLIADHAPFGAAAERLGQAFGVDMSKGVTADPGHADPETGNRTFILYSRDNHQLGSHPILEGRNAAERIGRVMTFSGQSLRGPEGSVALLALGDQAVDRTPPNEAEIRAAVTAAQEEARREGRPPPDQVPMARRNPGQPAAGRAQGIAFRYGRGRVVVLGEAAMLSAQLGENGLVVGMNRSGLDNRQLALNLMHWLSGLLD